MARRILAEITNMAAAAGGQNKEKLTEKVGGEKKEKEIHGVTYILKSPAIPDTEVVVNPPKFLMKKYRETVAITAGHPIGEDTLELFGPKTALPAYDPIFMGCHLMEGRQDLVGMRAVWDPDYDAFDVVYNEPYNGTKSLVTWHMSYVVYQEAVVATIEISFESRSSVGIHGTITAFTDMLPDWKLIIFRKERDAGEYESVEKGQRQVLTLMRHVTAVPIHSVSIQNFEEWEERKLNGCLNIDINLMNLHDGGTIAKGLLKFPPQNLGDYVGTISSKYGLMQVKISFINLLSHLPLDFFVPPSIQAKIEASSGSL